MSGSKEQLIQSLILFEDLSPKQLSKVSEVSILQTFKKGEYLFHEGFDCLYIYFILSGKAKLIAHSASGKDAILKIALKGDLLSGSGVVFDIYPECGLSSQAFEKTEVLKMKHVDFKNILNLYPPVSLNLLSILDKNLKDAYLSIKNMALEKVERRIALNILKLAEKTGIRVGNKVKLEIKLSRQDIANLSGTTIESAIRVMSKLKENKVVKEEEGYILILNKHKLVTISEY